MAFIKTVKGSTLLMVNGFTYWQHNTSRTIYYCSSKTGNGCKSRVKITKEGVIVTLREEHNHSPPVYKQRGGLYFKV